jgi:hypothetical protein
MRGIFIINNNEWIINNSKCKINSKNGGEGSTLTGGVVIRNALVGGP